MSVSSNGSTIEEDNTTAEHEECSVENCIDNEDKHRLICTNCTRFVHYICSRLPAYQIQTILNTRRSTFKCVNCVDISRELNQHKEVEELAKSLKRVSIENDKQVQVQVNIDRLKKREATFRRTIVDLNREIALLKQNNKQYQQNEHGLKETITSLKYENKFLTSKLEENKDSTVSDILEKSLKEFGESIEKSLTSAINAINKKNDAVENKIQKAIEANSTYANAVKLGSTQDDNHPPEETFQKIIREVKNVELTDEKLRQHRVNNLILHGVEEQRLGTEGKDKIADKVYVETFLETVHKTAAMKSFERVGLSGEEKTGPSKLFLNLSNQR